MQITITGLDKLAEKLGKYAKQLPYAAKNALNQTARDVQKAEQAEMPRVFDRPTPFSVKGVLYTQATKEKLSASVFIASETMFVGKSESREHLFPQIRGGSRPFKRSERVLRAAGILPNGKYIVPARDAFLDKYGNIPGPQMVQILSSVKAFGETGFMMNRTGRSRSKTKNRYFVMKRAGGMNIGIGERLGKNNARMVLAFVSKPQYKRRFNFNQIGQNEVYRVWKKNWREAWKNAIATAR